MATERIDVDICVIGGGSGGLSVAAGASQMGARVALIERATMGGDCLNFGCVPSKSLLAAAHAAKAMRSASSFGIEAVEPQLSIPRVRDHVRRVIEDIAPMDSVERFEGLGVRVIRAEARFVGRREIIAGEYHVRAKYFVVATGSTAAVPPVPGIETIPYLTNETIFELGELPDHLIVLGGGPIGCELSQAWRRLGARVTVLERFGLLPKDDPEAVDVIRRQLVRDGIDLREGMKVEKLARSGSGVAVEISGETGTVETIVGSHLLVAAGRRPSIEGLDLDAAGIAWTGKGIEVDDRLRSTNRRVFAVGDVAGGLQFTHVAGLHAGVVIRNALFKLPAKVKYAAVPWVTYTDPELAHVGASEASVRDSLGGAMRILRWSFSENDRARAEHAEEGFIKIVADRKGRIHGATIVGRHAGELIMPWALAIERKLKLGAMASVTVPYPTLSEVSKRVAGTFFTPTLFGDRTKKLVRFLLQF